MGVGGAEREREREREREKKSFWRERPFILRLSVLFLFSVLFIYSFFFISSHKPEAYLESLNNITGIKTTTTTTTTTQNRNLRPTLAAAPAARP